MKHKLLLLFFALAALTFVACSDEEPVAPEKPTPEVPEEPTPEPEPEPEPVFGSVTINYVNVANSEVLLSETEGDLAPGEYWFPPDRAGEVAGYELVSSDAQSAIIYDDGTTSNQINFQMQKIPKTGSIVIN